MQDCSLLCSKSWVGFQELLPLVLPLIQASGLQAVDCSAALHISVQHVESKKCLCRGEDYSACNVKGCLFRGRIFDSMGAAASEAPPGFTTRPYNCLSASLISPCRFRRVFLVYDTPASAASHLGGSVAATLQHLSTVLHEVQEGAVWCLADDCGTRHTLALG